MDDVDNLQNLKKVALAGFQDDDGQWRLTMLLQFSDGSKSVRTTKDTFPDREATEKYARERVLPLFQRAYKDTRVVSSTDIRRDTEEYLNDPALPKGLRCGAYDLEDGRRTFCGEAAVWTVEPVLLCEKHKEEFLKAYPEHDRHLSRIQ